MICGLTRKASPKNGAWTVAYRTRYADGSLSEPNSVLTTVKLEWPSIKAIELEISDSLPKLDEFWTDVSLLTLAGAAKTPTPKDGVGKSDAHESDSHALTFDWFFTGGNYQTAAEAVAEPALHDMVEAQARIISVSPPISLEKKA